MEQLENQMTRLARTCGRVGLGCMGMSEFYGEPNDASSLLTLRQAFDVGYRHFDTADLYGRGDNERLLRRFLRDLGSRRGELLVATKVGIQRSVSGPTTVTANSSPEYLVSACEQSLERLGVDAIDLLYVHRRNPATPIEATMEALARLVEQGKVRSVGLSEVSAQTLRAAHAVFPVQALQSEYSLWTRDVEAAVLPTCAELGIAFVAYAPLGRGFLSGELQSSALGEKDLRGQLPRFSPRNFEANRALLATLTRVAEELRVTRARVALGWVLSRGPFVHVIPGTRSSKHLLDNWASAELELSPEQLARLESAFALGVVQGDRYPPALLSTVNS